MEDFLLKADIYYNFNLPFDNGSLGLRIIVVCSRCYNKIPETGQLE